MKRVFVIVVDALGIGEMPDAVEFGDAGSNTLLSCSRAKGFSLPNFKKLGLFNIQGVGCGEKSPKPAGCFARLKELSIGKDTTVGHWELMGEVSEKPFPTYPNGFPKELMEEFSKITGYEFLCNLPYSGTKVLEDYGAKHLSTGALIVYTSADSVFQIAAHQDIVPLNRLYAVCEKARALLKGEHGVARVIARPFTGQPGAFVRTGGRHDYSLAPRGDTALDQIGSAGLATIGVGKIEDIFAGKGILKSVKTQGNTEGIARTLELMETDFNGLCFVNLVDTDMLYGHRNDPEGFAAALGEIDEAIPKMMDRLTADDLLIITGDHGCDPCTASTDHSREYVPLLMWGRGIKEGVDFGTLNGFAHVAGTSMEALGLMGPYPSVYKSITIK